MSNHEDERLKNIMFETSSKAIRAGERFEMMSADRWSIQMVSADHGSVRKYPSTFPDGPPDARRVHVMQAPDGPQMARLRALRLWHWNRLVEQRSIQTKWEDTKSKGLEIATSANDGKSRAEICDENIRLCKKEADFHLSQVQTLNYFFPLGDYAEYDAREGMPDGE